MRGLEFFRISRAPTPHERLAAHELRKGHYALEQARQRAAEQMRQGRVAQVIDRYVAAHVRGAFRPRLPT